MTDRSHEEIYNAVLDVKSMVVDLKGHVNDEVELLNQRINAQDTKIDGKLDNAELLTSLGFRLANTSIVRWGVGAIAATTVGTVVVREWLGPFWVGIVDRLVSLLQP